MYVCTDGPTTAISRVSVAVLEGGARFRPPNPQKILASHPHNRESAEPGRVSEAGMSRRRPANHIVSEMVIPPTGRGIPEPFRLALGKGEVEALRGDEGARRLFEPY